MGSLEDRLRLQKGDASKWEMTLRKNLLLKRQMVPWSVVWLGHGLEYDVTSARPGGIVESITWNDVGRLIK